MEQNAMRTWALKGAEQRLLEISEEAAAIYASFPELRDRGNGTAGAGRRGPGRPRKDQAESNGAGGPKRRKRTMSADARRRISEAQKARWAKQKGEAEGTAGTQAEASAETPSVAKSARKASRKSSRKKK